MKCTTTSITGKKYVNVSLDKQQVEILIDALADHFSDLFDQKTDGKRVGKKIERTVETRDQMFTALNALETE